MSVSELYATNGLESNSKELCICLQGPPPRAGTFLPFGLGMRLCPGNELAKLEIFVFLHHFLLGYK